MISDNKVPSLGMRPRGSVPIGLHTFGMILSGPLGLHKIQGRAQKFATSRVSSTIRFQRRAQ
jgi:hypothetical protein